MNPRRTTLTLLSLLLLCCPLAPARAAGSAPAPKATPMDASAESFNRGIRYRDKAWELEGELADATSDKKRAKLESKIERQYKNAVQQFESAVEANPGMHQAWGSLGYGLRKLGDYDASLEAYDKALELQPDYAEAIEYRGEAYLGLDRVEDAKTAWEALSTSAPALSNDLLVAMEGWVESRAAEPGAVEPAVIEAFASWVAERSMRAQPTGPADKGW